MRVEGWQIRQQQQGSCTYNTRDGGLVTSSMRDWTMCLRRRS